MNLSKKIFGISFVPVVLLLLGGLVSGIFVYSSKKATERYVSDYVERQNKLYEIYKTLGYGGGIHAFKNYILRFNDRYRLNSLKLLNKTKLLVKEYKTFSPLSLEEIKAMEKLESVIDLYLSKVNVADLMIKKNLSQSKIDNAVKVDDEPAVDALEELQLFFMKKRDIQLADLKNSSQMALNILIVVFLLALMVAFLMSRTISKKILYSIRRLTKISDEISRGNYEVKKSEIVEFSDDELKVLANQMIDMSANLNDAFEKLRRSNEDLTHFAFVASHDLQEPIKKVSSYVDLLEMEIEEDLNQEARCYMHEVKSSAQRMIKLIKALLGYSQITSAQIELSSVSLSEVIENSKKGLEFLIEETKAKIVAENLPKVFGNKELLQSLFQNLISNAIKYNKKDHDPLVKISVEETNDNRWKISVVDNGIGFDLKYVETILRPFGRIHSKKEYPGLGIGLPLCKKIIESHGGKLEIMSEEEKGSQFSFTLKAA